MSGRIPLCTALVAASLALAVAGCSQSGMRSTGFKPVAAVTEPAPGPQLKPAVLDAQPMAAMPASASEYPNINQPPREPSGKVLSPEERQRVVDELESIAANQSVSTPKKTQAALQEACADASVAAIDPQCKAVAR